MIYCDSHIHIADCKFSPDFKGDFPLENYFCVSSCHSKDDFSASQGFYRSFGIHPQAVLEDENKKKRYSEEDFDFLEELANEKKIVAVGEVGLDFFTPELKENRSEQSEIFERQLAIALKYNLPVVLHLRKSIGEIFLYSKILSKLPSVIFHSFPGTVLEVKSLLNHKINGFFSFGKPILNGRKSSIQCVSSLPLNRILLETDAPYQTLKNESSTSPFDIKKVYSEAAKLRNIGETELSENIFENFKKAYQIRL
ncbi:MAG: TatD family hydrolase [Treponema sp.]|nr:TatD family hydrolase [Treponema sp.]